MDSAGGALEHALAAGHALREIYIAEIVLDSDCAELADLGALAAAYAGGRTSLACDSALVLVDAGHIDPAPVARRSAHVAYLYHTLGAGLRAGAARRTFGLVHDGQPGSGIHGDSPELAGGHAVAAAYAAVGASGIAGIEGGFHLARYRAVVDVGAGTVLTASVATHDRHLGSLLLDLVAQYRGDLLHGLVAADRAELAVKVGRLHGSLGERTASGESASAAIRTRHHLLDLVYTRILLDLELLRHPEEHEREKYRKGGENHDGQNNSVTHFIF